MKVLLVGRLGSIIDDVQSQLRTKELELFGATGIDEVRATLARTNIDHVIMGGGLPLEDRLAIVRELFLSSETTSVHLKDVASGPEGMLPFARRVLEGLLR
ncbi:MAG TPA: hypothetical protein VK447_19315 [Myxococcaceae bacterium]|nr:hypothetical protein [Myxococcaceae bacterium]